MTNEIEVTFTAEEFETALENASYLAKKRLFKKADKLVTRAAYWSKGTNNKEHADYGPPGVRRKRLPPKDLQEYINNFVVINKDKVAKK